MPLNQPSKAHFGVILPLISSATTLGMSLFQFPSFYSVLAAEPSIIGRPFSAWWVPAVKTAAPLLAINTLTTSLAGFLSARWLRTHSTLETTSVSKWYTYGAMIALGHLVYAPVAARLIKDMVDSGMKGSAKTEEQVERENKEHFKKWILLHTVRTLTVDLPAVIAFAEGVALSLWII